MSVQVWFKGTLRKRIVFILFFLQILFYTISRFDKMFIYCLSNFRLKLYRRITNETLFSLNIGLFVFGKVLKNVIVTYLYSRDKIHYILMSKQCQSKFRLLLQESKVDETKFVFRAPRAGCYVVKFYAKSLDPEHADKHLTEIVEYWVKVREPANDAAPLPPCTHTVWGPGIRSRKVISFMKCVIEVYWKTLIFDM